MGLDMYACTLREPPAAPVDFEVEEATTPLHYWRKHPNLHGWMERLYREKGGKDANFNCLNLQLTAEDLDRLETAIRDRTLPHTEGFFFGVSDGSEVDDDLAFVAKARDALAAGLAVFYVSWW
ncbi:phosphoglycerate kinase [Ensifer sp. NBAIM29]|nr:phosphoglycerate kinase [Ensifer sp. NBAIM29]